MNNKLGRELIALAISEADEKYIKKKNEINAQLNKNLKTKYEKVGKDEEKYIEILRYNIIFYKSIIKKLEAILDLWIQNDVIFNTESIEKNISNITNSSREYVNKAMKNGNEFLNEKDKKIFLSYDMTSGLKRIEKIENDYKILNLYKDILAMVITVISSDVLKFSPILEMSTEAAKIDVMNEIFHKINEILFTTESPTIEFKDEALVDDENLDPDSLVDEEKCNSFIKYVNMITAPEISVKINDIFRDCIQIEEIAEEDAYKFPEARKECISCVALLLDYITPSKKKLFINAFRMYVVGLINANQFEGLVERLIRNHTFIDRGAWANAQRLVNASFNLENNKFFGKKYLENTDDDLNITQNLNIIEDADNHIPLKKLLVEDEKDLFEDEDTFSGKFKSKLAGLTGRFKAQSDYEDYEDFEDEIDDSEDFEYEKTSVVDKIGGIFNFRKSGVRHEEQDEDFDEFYEYDDDEEYDNYREFESTILKNIETGDDTLQDENAIAILKLREMSRKQEIESLRQEIKNLRKERALADEISKHGAAAFKDRPELIYGENDYAYVKRSSNSNIESDLFDDTIEGQISIFELENVENPSEYPKEVNFNSDTVEDVDMDKNDDDMFKPILGRTQRLNLEAIKKQDLNDNGELSHSTTSESDNSIDVAENIVSMNNNDESEQTTGKEDLVEQEKSIEENSFEELEILKSMNSNDVYNVKTPETNMPNGDVDKTQTVNKDDFSFTKTVEIDKGTISKFNSMKSEYEASNSSLESERFDKTEIADTNLSEEKQNLKRNMLSLFTKKDEENTEYIEEKGEKLGEKEKVSIDKPFKNHKNEKATKLMASMKRVKNDFKNKFDDDEDNKLEKKSRRKDALKIDENNGFSSTKFARDIIVILLIVALVFTAYIKIIKSFNLPSVDETNSRVKQSELVKKDKVNNQEKSTAKISEETESEKEKNTSERKAAAYDRKAEQFKGGKGKYYVVLIGATKDMDSAQTEQNKFSNRGIGSKIIRNNGYFMLKSGEYSDINKASIASAKLTNKGVQNYIVAMDKYFELKIKAYETRVPTLNSSQLRTDYEDLKNQLLATGKNAGYIKNLDEIYEKASKNGQ